MMLQGFTMTIFKNQQGRFQWSVAGADNDIVFSLAHTTLETAMQECDQLVIADLLDEF